MRKMIGSVIFAAMAVISAQGQQGGAADGPTQPPAIAVYALGHGVKAPELVASPLPLGDPVECRGKEKGKVLLTVIVDGQGVPVSVNAVNRKNEKLDRLAERIVGEERFTPGMLDGAPVAVGLREEMEVKACEQATVGAMGRRHTEMALIAQPVQRFKALPEPPEEIAARGEAKRAPGVGRIGGGVAPPRALFDPEAVYSNPARKAKISGICIITVMVDADGNPENPLVIRALGYGLDRNALDSVRRYRFKPAMKNGEPVPVMVNIEVNFRLY